MDRKVVLLCIALIFVLSTNGSFKGYFKGSKVQKGGSAAVMIGGGLAVVTLLGVGGYFLFGGDSKTCADYEQCSDGTQKKVDVDTTECEDDNDCQTKCCEPSDDNLGDGDHPGGDDPTPSAYIKYDSTSRTWGAGKPCVPFSTWAGDAIPGTNANTDTSVMASDGAVICQVPSADENGVCTGDCVDECNNYYGNSTSSDSKLHTCGVSGRSDNKCVATGNDLFRVYTDSDCSGP